MTIECMNRDDFNRLYEMYTKKGLVLHPLSRPDDDKDSPGKRPLIPSWQHLTKTPANILDFVNRGCNIGLVCGKASGTDGMDLDSNIFQDEALNGVNINTLISGHRDGRAHILFQHCDDFFSEKHHFIGIEYFGNNKDGAGSNLVLPPSVHYSGEVYRWKDPDAPLSAMPDKLKQNLRILFAKEDKLKGYFKKCRRCFTSGSKKYDKTDPRSKGLWDRPDSITVHGTDGRQAVLSIMGELRAEGCPDELLHMACKRFFGKGYDYQQTDNELKYIEPVHPKCETLRQYLNVECDGCTWQPHKQNTDDDVDNTNNELIPEYNTIEDIPLPQEDVIAPISFDGLPDYNFVKMFVDYIATVSDTYPEYAFLNGIAMLSTTLRRRLYIRHNGRTEYPNLWTLCLGQSGYARKGGAMTPAYDFLKDSLGNIFLSKDVSPEGLISELADTITTYKKTKDGGNEPVVDYQQSEIRKAECALWKDEAGQFYAQLNKPHMQSMKELLCHFYDCPSEYDKTLSAKKFHIGEIYHSMNLATTPMSFINNVTTKDVHTGFLARHNIVNPSYQKKRNPISEDTEEDLIKEVLFKQLIKIIDKLLPTKPIRVRIGEENLKILDNWCKEREEHFARERNETMGSFFARFQINVIKMALLLDLGNLPFYWYLYNGIGDNSQSENTIFIRPYEIISKKGFIHTQGDEYLNSILSHINNSNISDYNISSMHISVESLLYVLKLYDSVFLPYAYQICTYGKVEVFANYLSAIYKILQERKKIDRSTLMRLSHVGRRDDFNEAIATLKEAGAVLEYRVKGKTKPVSVYVYAPSPYTKIAFNSYQADTQEDNGFIELTKKGYAPPLSNNYTSNSDNSIRPDEVISKSKNQNAVMDSVTKNTATTEQQRLNTSNIDNCIRPDYIISKSENREAGTDLVDKDTNPLSTQNNNTSNSNNCIRQDEIISKSENTNVVTDLVPDTKPVMELIARKVDEWQKNKGSVGNSANFIDAVFWTCKETKLDPAVVRPIIKKLFKMAPHVNKVCGEMGRHDICGGFDCDCECHIKPATVYVKLKLLKDEPTFVGQNEKVYELKEGDVCDLPIINAQALIKRQIVVVNTIAGSSDRNTVRTVSDFIRDMQAETGSPVPIVDIIRRADTEGIKEDELTDIISKLKSSGVVLEFAQGIRVGI